MAAAAWSCVEKMLHDAQRISAPSSYKVRMSMAVWMVMCNEPVTFSPLRGFVPPYFLMSSIRPGISRSESCRSLRP